MSVSRHKLFLALALALDPWVFLFAHAHFHAMLMRIPSVLLCEMHILHYQLVLLTRTAIVRGRLGIGPGRAFRCSYFV